MLPHHTVTNHIIIKDEKYRGEFIFFRTFPEILIFQKFQDFSKIQSNKVLMLILSYQKFSILVKIVNFWRYCQMFDTLQKMPLLHLDEFSNSEW